MSKTILYARTSTADQTVETQRQQAEHAGFVIEQVIEDAEVSGVQTSLAERPNGKRLFDILRDGDTLVVRWVDRLGRNYDDIQNNIREFINRGVTIKTVINNMVFDAKPTDAMAKAVRDAMLSFMSAMAEAQTTAMKEAQAAGIENAKTNNPLAYRGRKPSYTFDQVLEVMEKFEHGTGVNQIAREVGLSKFAVSRITRNPEGARERLYLWEDLKDTASVS